MRFITLHKIYEETPITIHLDHIVSFEEGSEGGTSLTLTPAVGPGATLTITVREDYQAVRQRLETV